MESTRNAGQAARSVLMPCMHCCLVCLLHRSWAADNPAEFYVKYSVARAHQLYLLIYMALVLLFVGLLLTRDTVFSAWSIRASTNLHNKLFSRVLAAPILFFLRTPVGDVLNAFARDQVGSEHACVPGTNLVTEHSVFCCAAYSHMVILKHSLCEAQCARDIDALSKTFLLQERLTKGTRYPGHYYSSVIIHQAHCCARCYR